jgi:hypothetical protein
VSIPPGSWNTPLSVHPPASAATAAIARAPAGGDVDGHEETQQGALQPGAQQVPPKGRAHRTRAASGAAKRKAIEFRNTPSENQLHQSVAELLDWILISPAMYTTFPAGWGKLTKGTAGRLFASGLKRGLPDILVFDKDQKVVGIELKVGHNSQTSAQRAMAAQLQAVGITVYVCRSIEDVLAALYRENITVRSIAYGACLVEAFAQDVRAKREVSK